MWDFEKDENNQDKQGTKAWYEMRRKGIGASDVPIIFGVSKYMTPQKLWEIKTGKSDENKDTYITQVGKASESVIRALYESRCGFKTEPKVFHCKEWDKLHASIDAYGDFEGIPVIAEFKYVGKDRFEDTQKGIIRRDHMLQIQTQMLCAGLNRSDYVCFNGEDITILNVKRDEAIIEEILTVCKEFWSKVESNTPIVKESNDDAIIQKLEQRTALKKQVESRQAQIDAIDDELKETLKDYTGKKIGSYSVSWVEKKGTINYKKVPQIEGLDLEQYRGKSSRYLKIGGDKE